MPAALVCGYGDLYHEVDDLILGNETGKSLLLDERIALLLIADSSFDDLFDGVDDYSIAILLDESFDRHV